MALFKNPLWFLALILALAGCILLLPIILPVGPMYWDLFLYYDGAQRIQDGQIPSVDFSTPVGPLSYYMTYLTVRLFPNANPFLLIEWSYLIITTPLMAVVTFHVARTSWMKAYLLLIPFLFFSLAPFNIINLIPHTGLEAWGIYNRHSIHLLYVLLSVLIFIASPTLRIIFVSLLLLALFTTKITGFLAGGLILFGFFLAGKISLSLFVGANIIFWLSLSVAEISSGIISSYLRDVLALVGQNQGGIIRRFFSVGASQFDIMVAGAVLCGILYISHLRSDEPKPAYLLGRREAVMRFCNNNWFIFAMIFYAGFAFETQNSGGQPFVFLWPFFLMLLWRETFVSPALKTAALIAIAVIMIPSTSIIIQKTARAFGGMVLYEPLTHQHLKTLGMVSTSPKFYEREKVLRNVYIDNQEAYAATAKAGANTAFLIHTQPDFQITNLKEIDQAIAAIHQLEKDRGAKFETVWYMDFANPLGWLMQRRAPRYVQIGVDPTRTVFALNEEKRQALSEVDLALVPKCPITKNRATTEKHYAPAFINHERITLTPCMDALIKKK